MQPLRKILVVLLAVAWLAMTLHCRLETIAGFEFFTCAADSGSQPQESSDCSGACCAVEKSFYKTEQHRLTFPRGHFLQPLLAPVFDLSDTLPVEASSTAFTVAPPELPRRWQFVFRTASPPRAPSFAS